MRSKIKAVPPMLPTTAPAMTGGDVLLCEGAAVALLPIVMTEVIAEPPAKMTSVVVNKPVAEVILPVPVDLPVPVVTGSRVFPEVGTILSEESAGVSDGTVSDGRGVDLGSASVVSTQGPHAMGLPTCCCVGWVVGGGRRYWRRSNCRRGVHGVCSVRWLSRLSSGRWSGCVGCHCSLISWSNSRWRCRRSVQHCGRNYGDAIGV
jgi:hypothetical protein